MATVTDAILQAIEACDVAGDEPRQVTINPVDAGRLANEIPVFDVTGARMRLWLEQVGKGGTADGDMLVIGIPLAFDPGVPIGAPRIEVVELLPEDRRKLLVE